MKRVFLFSILAIAAIVSANAQQISVVAPGGGTTLYTDLNAAINEAADGSTVYLSGGGFQISDNTKITKKLTLIGIGHRPDNDHADGNTNVSGNFFFEEGSDNSTLMGVYLSGNVNIGTTANAVNTILVRYCNINSIQVANSNCQNVLINQNYIRNTAHGGNGSISFTNNILHSIRNVNGGVIDHNVIRSYLYYAVNQYLALYEINNSQITNNILRDQGLEIHAGSNCLINNNMLLTNWGVNCVIVTNWNDVFVGPDNKVNPTSNFALKGTQGKNAATDGTDIGIYGGNGFSDSALPPGPRIVSKKVAEQTDANGNLRVEITVSAQ
jgi:hypothetical protein